MVAPWILIVAMGWLSVLFSLGMVAAATAWYWRYARGSVTREGAIYHIFERLGRRRHERLETEFRQILREKGLREEDPYLETVARARVLDGDGDAEMPDVVHRASEALARTVPSSADRLGETFLDEIELEVTPVAHGGARSRPGGRRGRLPGGAPGPRRLRSGESPGRPPPAPAHAGQAGGPHAERDRPYRKRAGGARPTRHPGSGRWAPDPHPPG